MLVQNTLDFFHFFGLNSFSIINLNIQKWANFSVQAKIIAFIEFNISVDNNRTLSVALSTKLVIDIMEKLFYGDEN